MSTGHVGIKKVAIAEATIQELDSLTQEHVQTLSYPLDSWLEDQLIKATILRLIYDGHCIGYAGLMKERLQFFYVQRSYFRHAPAILEKLVADKAIDKVFVMSQDSLFSALIAEWDYEKKKSACFFTDGGGVSDTQLITAGFRTAVTEDVPRIRQVAVDFFEDASGGFNSLEERVAAGTIFVLEGDDHLLGCGIVEKGQFCHDAVSIGMFVNREHRRQGVAKTILLNLKQWAYDHGLKPVAGCWYYNTVSRKSLEAAGMVATSIGYEVILKGKEKPPLRTGNPPGELVE